MRTPRRVSSRYDPSRFRDEWKKRFLERSNLQDYLDVYVRVYEKHFTDAEINELIALQKGLRHPAIDAQVALVDARLEANRKKAAA